MWEQLSLPASHLSALFFHIQGRSCKTELYLYLWLLLKNSWTEMPNKIGKLCFGPIPTSLFVSKQKCEVKETSLFPAKWTSVHFNTQSAHLGFDPSHFLCDPSRLPVRLSVSTQSLEMSFIFSWTPLHMGNISAKLPGNSSSFIFPSPHVHKAHTWWQPYITMKMLQVLSVFYTHQEVFSSTWKKQWFSCMDLHSSWAAFWNGFPFVPAAGFPEVSH